MNPTIYLSILLSIYKTLDRNMIIYIQHRLCIYLSIQLSIYISNYLSIQLSIYPAIYLSNYLSIQLSIYPTIYLSNYLYIYPIKDRKMSGIWYLVRFMKYRRLNLERIHFFNSIFYRLYFKTDQNFARHFVYYDDCLSRPSPFLCSQKNFLFLNSMISTNQEKG